MTFSFEKAAPNEFESIRAFYWDLIDSMRQDGKGDNIGWKKGIYPSDEFLKDSLAGGTLFTLKDDCVILNSTANEGYNGIKWSKALADSEILIPHALAVTPHRQGQGIGKCFMAKIFDFAVRAAKKPCGLIFWQPIPPPKSFTQASVSGLSRPKSCSTRIPDLPNTKCLNSICNKHKSTLFSSGCCSVLASKTL